MDALNLERRRPGLRFLLLLWAALTKPVCTGSMGITCLPRNPPGAPPHVASADLSAEQGRAQGSANLQHRADTRSRRSGHAHPLRENRSAVGHLGRYPLLLRQDSLCERGVMCPCLLLCDSCKTLAGLGARTEGWRGGELQRPAS